MTSTTKTDRLRAMGSEPAALPPDLTSTDGSPLASKEVSIDRAIEYLLALKGESIDQLLADSGLKRRGTKVQAASRIKAGIAAGTITLERIQAWLEEAEGWGNHQVQFFNATDTVRAQFASPQKAEARLAAEGLGKLVDARRPLWPAEVPQIYTISYKQRRLRVSWAQQRTWKLREPSEDFIDGELAYQAYQIQHRRCFHVFELDSVTGQVALIMSKLPSGEPYHDLKERLLEDLNPLVPTAGLQIVDLRPTILRLESSPAVLRRRLNLVTTKQTRIEILSGAKDHDAYADPSIKAARHHWASNVAAHRGHFFWKITTGQIARLIGTKLLPRDNRFSIEGQCTEKEVFDVLRGMRAIS